MVALVTSIRANHFSRNLAQNIVELQKNVNHLQTEVIVLQKDIKVSLESIETHFRFIEKYAQSEYYRIYGDVGQISTQVESRNQSKKDKSK